MSKEIRVEKIRFFSWCKLVFIGLMISFFIMGVIYGAAAFFGAGTVTINGTHITGAKAIVMGPALGLFIGFMFAMVLSCLGGLGLWIYALFFPLRLRAVESRTPGE